MEKCINVSDNEDELNTRLHVQLDAKLHVLPYILLNTCKLNKFFKPILKSQKLAFQIFFSWGKVSPYRKVCIQDQTPRYVQSDLGLHYPQK